MDNHSLAMTSQQHDLQDIMKELKMLRGKLDKLENIVEKRLVGEVGPDRYEKKAIKEFERKRKAGKLEFVSLSKLEDSLS